MGKLLQMLDPLEEIRRLYFSTTKQTIERDMARALELLRLMASDEARERAAGYMHGLSDLQREWRVAARRAGAPKPATRKAGPPGKKGKHRTPGQG